MNKFNLHIIIHILILLVAFVPSVVFVSCRDGMEMPGGVPPVSDAESTVVLSLAMNRNTTRATEDCTDVHDPLAALDRETAVEDITVFIFSDPKGINGNDLTPLKFTGYYRKDAFSIDNDGNIILEFQVPTGSVNGGDRLAVFANMGDCSRFTTLGEIQNHVPERSFIHADLGKDCKEFAMSNAYRSDGIIRMTYGSDTEYRYAAELSIERLAARIDLDYTPNGDKAYIETMDDGALHYKVRGRLGKETSADLGSVYITHILPLNVMQHPSFALKRISTDSIGNFWTRYSFAGNLPTVSGIATSYVLEPRTGLKPGNYDSNKKWYGPTQAILAVDSAKFFIDDNHIRTRFEGKETLDITNGVILGYADENTQHSNNHDASCLTGLVIRAQFIPRVLHQSYNDVDDILGADSIPEIEIPRGTDIWRYTPGTISTTEGDVKYFASEILAKAYAYNHPEDQAVIKHFPKGVCFYHLWLRHLTASGDTDGIPMAYGIVRNHVYRVSLSFKGIGREGVKVESPDNVEFQITVRPWYVINHPEIIM